MSITSQIENEPINRSDGSHVVSKPVKKALAPLSTSHGPLKPITVQQQLYATDGSNVQVVDKYMPSPSSINLVSPLIAIPNEHLDMSSPGLSFGSTTSPPDSAASAHYPQHHHQQYGMLHHPHQQSAFPSPFPSPFDMPLLTPLGIGAMPGSPMPQSPISLQAPPSPMMYSPYGSPYAPFTGISFADNTSTGSKKNKSGPVALVSPAFQQERQ